VSDFWHKYVIGLVLAAVLVAVGTAAIVERRIDVTDYRHPHYFPGQGKSYVTGAGAVCVGVLCFGAAALLFAFFYLEDAVQTEGGLKVAYVLQVFALVVCVVALLGLILWCCIQMGRPTGFR
jgi:heme/copper-type cytochrome/quinol oxidase subunit 4